jgi:hypothetical protein
LQPGEAPVGPAIPRDGPLLGALFESQLSARMGADVVDSIVITTGAYAYRRPDGVGVVPAALLGA